MKRHDIKKTLLLFTFGLMCLCGCAKTTFSQETSNSIQTDAEQRRVALINALERAQSEVVAGRKYIDELQTQVKSKQALIDKLVERDAARAQVEQSRQKEIAELRAAIDEQEKALQIRIDEVEYLKKELAKTQKKLRSSHRREKFLVAALGALALFLLHK